MQGDESLLFLTPEGHEVDTPFANLHEGEASVFPPAGLVYGEDIEAQEIFKDAMDGANMTFEEAQPLPEVEPSEQRDKIVTFLPGSAPSQDSKEKAAIEKGAKKGAKELEEARDALTKLFAPSSDLKSVTIAKLAQEMTGAETRPSVTSAFFQMLHMSKEGKDFKLS